MMSNVVEEAYVLAYSRDVRRAFVEALRKRWIACGWIYQQSSKPQGPITDGFEILEPERAGHDLFMAIMRYYRAFGTMDSKTAPVLIALHRGIHDPERCLYALNDALCFFVNHEASRDDAGVRHAVQAAQLSLKALQGTWAELPAMSTPVTEPRSWML